jgi:hypothetical protein
MRLTAGADGGDDAHDADQKKSPPEDEGCGDAARMGKIRAPAPRRIKAAASSDSQADLREGEGMTPPMA